MIFSRFDPSSGLYDYYDAPSSVHGLADDLPVPELGPGTPLGVPSVEVGRSLPNDGRHIGRGERAQGVVMPQGNSSALGDWNPMTWHPATITLAALGIALGFDYLRGHRWRRVR